MAESTLKILGWSEEQWTVYNPELEPFDISQVQQRLYSVLQHDNKELEDKTGYAKPAAIL